MLFFCSLEFSHFVKSSLFISLCNLRDLRHQEIPRELCGGGDPPIFLLSHGKNFWWDRSGKFKNTRKRGTDQENSKKQHGKNGGKKKERFLHSWRFSCSCVLHRSTTPRATALMRPSLRRTHSYENLPYNLKIVISFSILLICLTLWISVQYNQLMKRGDNGIENCDDTLPFAICDLVFYLLIISNSIHLFCVQNDFINWSVSFFKNLASQKRGWNWTNLSKDW